MTDTAVDVDESGGRIEPGRVRAQLAKVLADPTFVNAPQLTRLLQHLVDAALTGERREVKENALGAELFGRGAKFDSRLDNIVRSHARRLRQRLHEYFSGPGRSDPIVIEVPKGHYHAVFRTNAAPTRRRAKHVIGGAIAVGSICALALAYFAIDRAGDAQEPVAPTKSIAVLPFMDLSEQHDQQYLADGMSEEIINLLASMPALLVPARTSSFHFKGTQTTIPEIARKLGVAHVLEGSVRRSGDQLRVTARLVRADNGYQLWSQAYDRPSGDIFKVQDEIANAVVEALQIKIAGGELARRNGGTQNLDAYELYLRAVNASHGFSATGLNESEEYLKRAVELDPNYGLAWALMAGNLNLKISVGAVDSEQGRERMRQLAQRALQLSPDNVQAHLYLGLIEFADAWDWTAWERASKRALTLDPNHSQALADAAQLAAQLGRWDDAERFARSALERDPLNTFAVLRLGSVYFKTRRLAEAETAYRKVLELAPDFQGAHALIGMTLLAQDKPAAALAEMQQEPNEAFRLSSLPHALHAVGRLADADAALNTFIEKWGERFPFRVAHNYAYRGDRDLAFLWLERAYRKKDEALLGIVGDPLFAAIADDPRYRALLRSMKLPTGAAS